MEKCILTKIVQIKSIQMTKSKRMKIIQMKSI